MAMIKCYECNESISSKAKACPRCGAKRKSKAGKLLLWFFIVLFGLGWFGKTMNEITRDKSEKLEAARLATLTPEQRAAEEKVKAAQEKKDKQASAENAAIYACHNFIEKSLKDPDSVKYTDGGEAASIQKDGTFRVIVSARAKNGFGAMVPSAFECRLGRVGDNWFLHGLKEAPMQ